MVPKVSQLGTQSISILSRGRHLQNLWKRALNNSMRGRNQQMVCLLSKPHTHQLGLSMPSVPILL